MNSQPLRLYAGSDIEGFLTGLRGVSLSKYGQGNFDYADAIVFYHHFRADIDEMNPELLLGNLAYLVDSKTTSDERLVALKNLFKLADKNDLTPKQAASQAQVLLCYLRRMFDLGEIDGHFLHNCLTTLEMDCERAGFYLQDVEKIWQKFTHPVLEVA